MASNPTSTRIQNHSEHYCCCDQNNLHLHVEIENLKQRLLERERHIVKMETNFLKEAEKFPNGEFAALSEELLTWQDKYSRLFEAHKRVQKVNQGLEDKLLKMVDKCETEKNNLQEDVTMLTKKLIEQHTVISKLHEENERYRNDLNIAIQLLQCKPSNFVPRKFDMLPPELQVKVRSYIANKQRKFTDCIGTGNHQKHDMKTIKVPISTFPPTAMVYSLGTDKEQHNINGSSSGNNSNNGINSVVGEETAHNATVDIVSAAIMAKILKEREKERSNKKHCQTCSCAIILYDNKSCQTDEIVMGLNNVVSVIESDSLNNNLNLLDESTKEMTLSECVTTNTVLVETDSDITKTALQDLVDLNGYNSDHNYQYFKNLPKNSSSKIDDSNTDLISFDTTGSMTASAENIRGPRLCSVRLQPGSNNILLDNVAHFSSPVLYRRRANANDLPESEPTVHLGKIRTFSVSSNYIDGECATKVSTETEI